MTLAKLGTSLIFSLAAAFGFLCLNSVFAGGWVFTGQGFRIDFAATAPWALGLTVLVLLHSGLRNNLRLALAWVHRSLPPKVAPMILLGLGLWLFAVHVARHWSFNTHFFDHVYVHQPLWHGWRSPLLWCSVCRGSTYFGEHLSFSLLALEPWVALFRPWWWRDLGIFLLQVILLVGGTFAILNWGPLREKRDRWWIFVVCVASSIAWRSGGTWDFREDHLAFFGFSIAVVGLFRGWVGVAIGGTLFAYLAKENMSVLGWGLAAPIAWHLRRPRLALVWLVGSVAFSIIAIGSVWPLMYPGVAQNNNIASRLPTLGSTPLEILWNLITAPSLWMELLRERLSWSSIKYCLTHLMPFVPAAAFVGRQGKSWWLWLAPVGVGMAMNTLSSTQTQTSQAFHYDLGHLPFLIFFLSAGLAMWPSRLVVQRALPCILLALIASGRWPTGLLRSHWPTWAQVAEARRLGSLSVQGPIVAGPNVLPHLCHLEGYLEHSDHKPGPNRDRKP